MRISDWSSDVCSSDLLPTRDRLTGCHACRDVASDQQDRRFRWWGEQENGSRAEHLEPPDEAQFICRASSGQRPSPLFLRQALDCRHACKASFPPLPSARELSVMNVRLSLE